MSATGVPIGNIRPAEAEEHYCATLDQTSHGSMTQAKQPPANPARFKGIVVVEVKLAVKLADDRQALLLRLQYARITVYCNDA
jgi:hypothetical protein